jgi:hypothetical protein
MASRGYDNVTAEERRMEAIEETHNLEAMWEPGPLMTKAEFAELLTNRLKGHITESDFKEFLDRAWEKRMIEDENLLKRRANQQAYADRVRTEAFYRERRHAIAQSARNDAETVLRERKRAEDVQYEGLEGDGLGGLSHHDRFRHRGDDIHHDEDYFGHGGDYDDDDDVDGYFRHLDGHHSGPIRSVHPSKSDNYGRGIPPNTVYAHQSHKNLVRKVKGMTTDR